MTFKEHPLQLDNEGKQYYSVHITCDLCDIEMYYNETLYTRQLPNSEDGLYICKFCKNNILKKFLQKN